MAAPVVIEVVASPPPQPRLSEALVSSCSDATGGDGCVLDSGEATGPEARARVVVSFTGDYAHAWVRTRSATRHIAFRDGDPLDERFRAAGLVAAALASGAASPRPAAVADAGAIAPPASAADAAGEGRDATDAAPVPDVPARPPAAPTDEDGSRVWAGGVVGLGGLQPRAGAAVGAGLGIARSPVFVALSVTYEQTLHEDAQGLGEQLQRLGAGAGIRLALAGPVSLLAPVQLEIEHARLSVRQPATGRTDAGSRARVGLAAAGQIACALDDRLEAFVGVRAAVLDEE